MHASRSGKRLNVPYYRQETDSTCGLAVIRMYLGYWKFIVPTEKQLRDQEPGWKTGLTRSELVKILRRQGLLVKQRRHGTISDLTIFIDHGFPVAVDLRHPTQGGHFAIVDGYGKGEIYLKDPLDGKRRLAEASFLKLWKPFDTWLAVAKTPYP
ncbi:MAG: cysteine peptidase family C39 domain-containing protein [Patescibacteria group bacterium]